MAVNVCVPLANGFEEIEAMSLIDVMRRGGLNVIVAGVGGDVIYGAHNVRVIPDTKIELVNADELDLVVLPGGLPGAINLAEDETTQNLLKEMDKKGKWLLVKELTRGMQNSPIKKYHILILGNPKDKDGYPHLLHYNFIVTYDRRLPKHKSVTLERPMK